jgi:LysR family glycine cleavage system transcriptional activator
MARNISTRRRGVISLAISQAFMQIESATGQLARHASGELKLAVAPTFLDRWLLSRFNDFTNRDLEIKLDIYSSIGVISFNQSDIDMAMYIDDGEWGGVSCTHLRPSFLVPA